MIPSSPLRAPPPSFPARQSSDLRVSFEFFPPKTEAMAQSLWQSVKRLEPLQPSFVSVTYGAGGSTRQRTHETVARIKRETTLAPAAHLTCVGASKAEIDEVASSYWDTGIRHIVALRGDAPPEANGKYQSHPQGYAFASDLIAGLKRNHDFEISAAAYPEMHPEAPSADADLENLKRKVDAGASRAITQFFFEPEDFLRFRDRAAAAGIKVPVVPGVLPVSNFAQVTKFAAMCGARVPAWMADLFDGLDDDMETRRMIAASVAGDLCRRLQAEGIRDFHFYTLNRADLTFAICHLLGIRPQTAKQ
ncbi:MAG: methylenetetrahydrofolate reductase [Alphaproteobacteria bacterium]|jgi:methylenetetrahydrofolate reductase (NADPH)|nr:methylenetetrahydrofolate reductase [Alphaproteobacteria bacterium]